MTIPRRRFLHLAVGAAALPAVSRIAWAQVYPSRPITMIVPGLAGGAPDTIGRLVAERIRGSLGQPIIIENVSGASQHQSPTADARQSGWRLAGNAHAHGGCLVCSPTMPPTS